MELLPLLTAWFTTPDWRASEAFLTANQAALLTPAAAKTLHALAESNPDEAVYSVHHQLLAYCRLQSIPAGYQRLRHELLLAAFLQAENTEQMAGVVTQSDPADLDTLAELVNTLIANATDPQDSGALADRLAALEHLREQAANPFNAGLSAFLYAEHDDEARDILLDDAELLLTPEAGARLASAQAEDPADQAHLSARQALWAETYAAHTGQLSAEAVLDATLRAWIATADWAQSEAYLHAHAATLLTPAAHTRLAAQRAAAPNDDQLALHAQLLDWARATDTTTAYAQWRDQRILMTFLDVQNESAMAELVASSSPEALDRMEYLAASMAAHGEAANAELARTNLAYLREARATFTSLRESPLVQGVLAFLYAENETAAQALLAAHADLLLTPEAAALLDAFAQGVEPATQAQFIARAELWHAAYAARTTPPPPTPAP